MQTVILCGGKGTRMGDMAETLPKPLAPIGEKPILWHIMKTYSHFGFNDFILCLGYKGGKIKEHFENNNKEHLREIIGYITETNNINKIESWIIDLASDWEAYKRFVLSFWKKNNEK